MVVIENLNQSTNENLEKSANKRQWTQIFMLLPQDRVAQQAGKAVLAAQELDLSAWIRVHSRSFAD